MVSPVTWRIPKTNVKIAQIVSNTKASFITNTVIRKTFNEANSDEECAGVITWMHTFSPAKSWILGLQEYRALKTYVVRALYM
jgi:L-arabinose isomerase